MFCSNCGQSIDDKADVCVHCGVSVKKKFDMPDEGGIGWGLLGCCIPIVGLVLYLVWKDVKPNTAKSAGTGALVAVSLLVLYYILIFAIGFAIF